MFLNINLAPNFLSDKLRGIGPGVFLGTSSTSITQEHNDAEAILGANNITTDDMFRSLKGRDVSGIPLPHHCVQENLEGYAALLLGALGPKAPFLKKLQGVINA